MALHAEVNGSSQGAAPMTIGWKSDAEYNLGLLLGITLCLIGSISFFASVPPR